MDVQSGGCFARDVCAQGQPAEVHGTCGSFAPAASNGRGSGTVQQGKKLCFRSAGRPGILPTHGYRASRLAVKDERVVGFLRACKWPTRGQVFCGSLFGTIVTFRYSAAETVDAISAPRVRCKVEAMPRDRALRPLGWVSRGM